MKGLRQVIEEARGAGKAVGHFNVANLEMLWGVFRAARSLEVPVIIGVSEGERDAMGLNQAVALVKSIRDEYDFPIFLNADHTYSVDKIKEAIDAGFDSVIFDGAQLNFEENISKTKEVVAYAKSVGREVVVEGEIGFIGKSSQVLADIPMGVNLDNLTTAEEAEKFVKETGVDMLAPAVGNFHGMLSGRPDPNLNIERVKEISLAAGVPLVLHGASGNTDADIKAAILAGVAVVHVSTELRVAWRDAIKLSFAESPDEAAPYKLMKPVIQAVEKVAEKKLRLFNGLS